MRNEHATTAALQPAAGGLFLAVGGGLFTLGERMNGTVKKVIEGRGFGFIRQPDGEDLFFHIRDVEDLEFNEALTEMRVEFNIIQTERGPRAVSVRAAS